MEDRDEAMGRCDHPEEIDAAAGVIAEALRGGGLAEVAIAPGNGTRYCFLFVPVAGAATYETPRTGLESGAVADGGVWIARVGWGPKDSVCYPLALMGRRDAPAPSYIAEKWFPHQDKDHISDDVFVMEALIQKVGELT